MELRQNQIKPVDIGLQFLKKKSAKPSIIVAPTAFGKSIVIAKLAKDLDEKILILQPSKELLEQNFNKFISLGGYASIYSASFNSKVISKVTYATIGSIKNIGATFRELGFTKMIVDECFVAGTLIDGKPIEQIKVGDYVKSYNHNTQKIERKKVLRLFKKIPTTNLIKFKFSNGVEFVCTDNHPLYTKELGYVTANVVYLCPNKYTLIYDRQELRNLQHSFPSKMELYSEKILRFRVSKTKARAKRKGFGGEVQSLQKGFKNIRDAKKELYKNRSGVLLKNLLLPLLVRFDSKRKALEKNEIEKSNVDGWCERKNDRIIKGKNISFARWKRAANKTPNDATLSNRLPYGISNRNSVSQTFVSVSSELLQSRPSLSRKEDSDRSGWQITQAKEVEIFGQKKDGNIKCVRVESCEIYQQGCGAEFEQVCKENIVYNFEVEDNNNYFANGVLVHNCHLYPRDMDSMLGKFLKDSGITHVLGLTATPLKLQQNADLNGNTFSKLVMLTSRSKNGNFFKEIIYVCQIQEMVDLGFWAKLEYEYITIDNGMLKFNSTKADYTEESLRKVYEENHIFDKIVERIERLEDRKSILVFVPSVAEAKQLQTVIPNSYAVYGDMDKKERDFVINGFKKLQIRVIINVNVLSVGFDHPELDCIISARPTASLSWLYQAYGRGTRIHPNKQDCLIIDFSGNTAKFGRIEKLEIVKENVWKIYGEGGKLLSGVPMHEIGEHTKESEHEIIQDKIKKDIEKAKKESEPFVMPFGKYKGDRIKEVPKSYRDWMLKEFDWKSPMDRLKRELEKIKKVEDEKLFDLK